jgi:hypothetical protein
MGWRSTAILALLIAAIGTYLWFEEAPPDNADVSPALFGAPPSQEATTPVQPLLDFQPAEVSEVELDHSGETRRAERQGQRWNPPADSAAIDDFLNNLATLGVLTEIAAGADELRDYGLEPPKSVVRLRVRGHAGPLVLQIGDHNPATTGVYVRIGNSGPVALAGALVAWEFDKAFRALQNTPAGP